MGTIPKSLTNLQYGLGMLRYTLQEMWTDDESKKQKHFVIDGASARLASLENRRPYVSRYC